MSEDHECDLRDWFAHGVEELPRAPFTQAVVDGVRRKERLRQLRHYAAVVLAFLSLCLLLPDLVVPFDMLANLPPRVLAAGGELWPLLMMLVLGVAYRLIIHARNAGYRGGG